MQLFVDVLKPKTVGKISVVFTLILKISRIIENKTKITEKQNVF